MLTAFLDWISFRTWFDLACLATGTVLMAPLLVSRRYRRRLYRLSGDEPQALGLAVLALLLIGIGLYNRLG